jgi:lipopolysaccharide export system permease protein
MAEEFHPVTVLFGYFLRLYLATVLRVLGGLIVLVALIDMVEINRRASEIPQFGLSDLLMLALLRVPSFVQTAIPFMVLIAAMMCLLALNKRQELVITRASGLSAWQFIAPICVGSFLLGVVIVAVFSPLSSATLRLADAQETRLGMKSDPSERKFPWLREKTDSGAMIIGAERSAENGTLLSQVRFFMLDADGGLLRRVEASQARLVDGAWRLTNAMLVETEGPASPLAQIEIPSSLDPRFLQSALANPKTVSFFALPESSRVAEAFGLASGPYDMEFHGLIALPALLVAMSLIAATVSLRFARFGQSSAAIMGGVMAGFLLYVLIEIAKTLGEASVAAPIVCAWLPVVAAAMFGVTFLLYREDG